MSPFSCRTTMWLTLCLSIPILLGFGAVSPPLPTHYIGTFYKTEITYMEIGLLPSSCFALFLLSKKNTHTQCQYPL